MIRLTLIVFILLSGMKCSTIPPYDDLKPNMGSDRNNWSDDQGRMNWYNAKSKCDSIGMRLPTKNELEAGVKEKIINATFSLGTTYTDHFYWTSEEEYDDSAIPCCLRRSGIGHSPIDLSPHRKGDEFHVRCIRKELGKNH